MGTITAKDLRNIQFSDEVFALLDVRTQEEYKNSQILGATSTIFDIALNNIPILIKNKDIKVILYSNTEKRARTIENGLKELGYTNVSTLEGGLNAWKNAGYPTVEGVHVFSKTLGEIVINKTDLIKQIKPAELLQELKEKPDDYTILEVRPTAEVEKTGSLPGSEYLPGVELYPSLYDYVNTGKKVVLTCAGRTRSIIAAETAGILGYDHILELENGTRGWELAGGTLEQNIPYGPAPSKESYYVFKEKTQTVANKDNLSFIDAATLNDWNSEDPDGFITLDVRQYKDFIDDGHIAFARNYEGGQIVQNSDDALLVHNYKYVLVGDNDIQPVIAAYWMKRMGYADVHILKDGLQGWISKGYDLVHDDLNRILPDPVWKSEEDFMEDPVAEANHYIEWESSIIDKEEYMEAYNNIQV